MTHTPGPWFKINTWHRNGGCGQMHTTNPEKAGEEIIKAFRRRVETIAIYVDGEGVEMEVGWVYKHDESGWVWCIDADYITIKN